MYFWSSLGRQGNSRDLYHEVWPSITVKCMDCYWTFSRHKNGEHIFIRSRIGLNLPNYILVYKILLISYFSMYIFLWHAYFMACSVIYWKLDLLQNDILNLYYLLLIWKIIYAWNIYVRRRFCTFSLIEAWIKLTDNFCFLRVLMRW